MTYQSQIIPLSKIPGSVNILNSIFESGGSNSSLAWAFGDIHIYPIVPLHANILLPQQHWSHYKKRNRRVTFVLKFLICINIISNYYHYLKVHNFNTTTVLKINMPNLKFWWFPVSSGLLERFQSCFENNKTISVSQILCSSSSTPLLFNTFKFSFTFHLLKNDHVISLSRDGHIIFSNQRFVGPHDLWRQAPVDLLIHLPWKTFDTVSRGCDFFNCGIFIFELEIQ